MTINPSLRSALRRIRDAKIPVPARTKARPDGVHHKTIEGLEGRLLIERRGAGYVATRAGRDLLERLTRLSA